MPGQTVFMQIHLNIRTAQLVCKAHLSVWQVRFIVMVLCIGVRSRRRCATTLCVCDMKCVSFVDLAVFYGSTITPQDLPN